MSSAAVVFAAVPTLFSSDGELDRDANRALYKFVAGLVDGLFVAGTTGEFPALDETERLSLIELALAEAGPDRVPGVRRADVRDHPVGTRLGQGQLEQGQPFGVLQGGELAGGPGHEQPVHQPGHELVQRAVGAGVELALG